MKQRILFLDMDGVLNSDHYFQVQRKDHVPLTRHEQALGSIDPEAVRLLNQIITLNDCRVVLSSYWRTLFDLKTMQEMLEDHGFHHKLAAQTPKFNLLDVVIGSFSEPLRFSDRGDHNIYQWMRSFEIEAFLHANYTQSERRSLCIAILDDMPSMGRLGPWFVKTRETIGLQAQHVEAVQQKFQNPLDTLLDNLCQHIAPAALEKVVGDCLIQRG